MRPGSPMHCRGIEAPRRKSSMPFWWARSAKRANGLEITERSETRCARARACRLRSSKIQDVVDDREQRLGRRLDAVQVVALLVVERGVENELGHAEDAVHRGADLVAHVGEEIAFGTVGRLGRLLRLQQLEFALLALGDVADKVPASRP